jgi:hypothetical protein
VADSAIFIGFGKPARGRETEAVQVFGEAMQHYGSLAASGEIESVEAVFLEPHGGDLGGFILLRGEREKLDAVRRSEAFELITFKADIVVESIGVVNASVGEGVARGLGVYQEALKVLS